MCTDLHFPEPNHCSGTWWLMGEVWRGQWTSSRGFVELRSGPALPQSQPVQVWLSRSSHMTKLPIPGTSEQGMKTEHGSHNAWGPSPIRKALSGHISQPGQQQVQPGRVACMSWHVWAQSMAKHRLEHGRNCLNEAVREGGPHLPPSECS